MRISDWSSDACSSDLSASDSGSYGLDGGLSLDGGGTGGGVAGEDGFESLRGENLSLHDHLTTQAGAAFKGPDLIIAAHLLDLIEERSEGRRVGKECVCTGGYRWAPIHLKKKEKKIIKQ